jgi:hypothetical protein
MELYCDNEECRWHTERKGGKFHFRSGKTYCDECVHTAYLGEPGKNLWDFTTMNIGSHKMTEPIHVKSLAHLRQLERQHGVVSVAANYDSSRWNEPPRGR